MMVRIMSNSKRIKEKVHFYVSILAGAVQFTPISEMFYNLNAAKVDNILLLVILECLAFTLGFCMTLRLNLI